MIIQKIDSLWNCKGIEKELKFKKNDSLWNCKGIENFWQKILKNFNFSKLWTFSAVKWFYVLYIRNGFFCVFVGLFWSTSWNRNWTPNSGFKRKNYFLENASFRRLLIFQKILIQKASKTRFFLFVIFKFFEFFKFYCQNFLNIQFLYNSKDQKMWLWFFPLEL